MRIAMYCYLIRCDRRREMDGEEISAADIVDALFPKVTLEGREERELFRFDVCFGRLVTEVSE